MDGELIKTGYDNLGHEFRSDDARKFQFKTMYPSENKTVINVGLGPKNVISEFFFSLV